MNPKKISLLAGLCIVAGQPALAQEAPPWNGPADCRFPAMHPASAQAPAWDGACKAGFADGKGRLAWRDDAGKPYTLELTLAAGVLQGEGKLRFPDGTVYIGALRGGVPDGNGYFRDPDGTQYEGDVRMGERSGVGEALYADGNIYKGEWKNGKRDGTGVQTYILGGRYEGGWKDDRPSGQGRLVYAGGQERAVAVRDGRVPGRTETPTSKVRYDIKEDQAPTGSAIRRNVARAIPVPPDLSYQELSAEQRAAVDGWFPALAPGDEPPYPMHGPAAFLRTAQRIVSAMRVQGDIHVYVLVDKDGKPASVTAIGLNDPEASKALSMAAGLVKYKPASCAGQPCDMTYAYRLALTMAH